MAIALIIVYVSALLFILAYSCVQLHLVINYLGFHRKKSREEQPAPPVVPDPGLPRVTVQLPVFNELYVVERLIDNIAKFDYPADRLEIQVLDDSTDETLEISRKRVETWRGRGIDIKLLHREDRGGYKAGALQEGLKTAGGEYIAIFDADFLPSPDFLRRTVPHLVLNPQLGAVQTRWEHLNRDHSLLTRVQAFALDAHFTVEQQGRCSAGYFMNFNGTAGVWRRECIESSGGWEADTLTEDLDLSYRAQLKGWKLLYLEEVTAPAELPVAMNAVKSQQFRWNKGGAETARKHLRRIWASGAGLGEKIHASAHLLGSSVFLPVLACALLSFPLLLLRIEEPGYSGYFNLLSVFFISLIFLGNFYFFSFNRRYKSFPRALGKFVLIFPTFLTMSMGISLHNAWAVLEGALGFKSPFVRTPKFNLEQQGGSWKKNKYLTRRIGWLTIVEAVLSLYFLAGVGVSVYFMEFMLAPFHLMLAAGFGTVAFYSIKHARLSG